MLDGSRKSWYKFESFLSLIIFFSIACFCEANLPSCNADNYLSELFDNISKHELGSDRKME